MTQKTVNLFTNNAGLIAQLSALVADDLARAIPLMPPKSAFGRFTYTISYQLVNWWTKHPLRSPAWKATCC